MKKSLWMLLLFVAAMSGEKAAFGKVGPFELDLPEYSVSDRVSLRNKMPVNSRQTWVELDGPGCINHIWMTLVKPNSVSDTPRIYMGNRKIVIRIYFDDSKYPNVEAPVGDFFGMMHGVDWYPINTEFLSALAWSGYNSYFQMPFAKNARFEFETGDESINFYLQIDWHRYPGQEMHEKRRFCATWRRENPTHRYGEDYFMTDINGPGQLIGFVYGVRLFDNVDRWSHGGSDNIYIDGLGDHPAFIRGIGGEDTFGTAYSGALHSPATHLYASMPYYYLQDIGEARPAQRVVGYRFFVKDSIKWYESLHMRFGCMENDISSIVYWYQEKPIKPSVIFPSFKDLLPGSELTREKTVGELPYSGSWKVGGPFDNESDIGISKALKGELLSEVSSDPNWVVNRNAYHGFIDFNHLWRPYRRGVGIHYNDNVAVAHGILTVDKDMTVNIRVAWDDHLVMQINQGSPIDMGNHNLFNQKTVKVPLKKGDNYIVLTLSNTTGLNNGGWAFAFKATDPAGNVILPKSAK